MRRFLIINPFGIGDVLFTTPMIERIKSQYPQSYIGYICNVRTAPIITSNPSINKAYIYEKDEYRGLWKISKMGFFRKAWGLMKEIGKEKFDLVFDLSLAREFGFFSKLVGIGERLGYDYRNRGVFLTERIKLPNGYSDMHMVDYYMRLLDRAGIKPLQSPMLKIYIPDKDRQRSQALLSQNGITAREPYICIAPGGGASWGQRSFRKQWPMENFAKLASALCDGAKAKVVLTGGASDSAICQHIKNKERRCIDLCGETGLLSFAALIQGCELLLSNDGGPLHIAVAAGAKTVSIFGPVDENVYGPYPLNENHMVIKYDGLRCRPCYRSFKMPECSDIGCLEMIYPDVVIEAAKKLLSIN